MRSSLLSLLVGLALAACSPREAAAPPAPGAEPALAVLVTREETAVRADGVTQLTRYQERLVRAQGRVWTERVLDPRTARVQEHEEGSGRHHAHDWSVVPRLVERQPDGGVALRFALMHERELVGVEPPEFESVGFAPDWSEVVGLFPRAALAQLGPLAREDTPAGARWLGRDDGNTYVRVLWSDRLALALEVETGRKDGAVVRRARAELQALPTPLPWEGTRGFVEKDITDFRD